jgi:hypothetical protein
VSVAAASPGPVAQVGVPTNVGEGCPLCGTPLRPEQEWCLRCGAAARTRLASTPNWRTPLIALGLTIALALGALTASLVKLAGGPTSTPATTITRTVTAPTSTTSGSVTPGATTPGSSTPGGASGLLTPGATAPGSTTPRSTTPGALVPGASTTTPRASAHIPKTGIRISNASKREVNRILSLLSPHAKH